MDLILRRVDLELGGADFELGCGFGAEDRFEEVGFGLEGIKVGPKHVELVLMVGFKA